MNTGIFFTYLLLAKTVAFDVADSAARTKGIQLSGGDGGGRGQ